MDGTSKTDRHNTARNPSNMVRQMLGLVRIFWWHSLRAAGRCWLARPGALQQTGACQRLGRIVTKHRALGILGTALRRHRLGRWAGRGGRTRGQFLGVETTAFPAQHQPFIALIHHPSTAVHTLGTRHVRTYLLFTGCLKMAGSRQSPRTQGRRFRGGLLIGANRKKLGWGGSQPHSGQRSRQPAQFWTAPLRPTEHRRSPPLCASPAEAFKVSHVRSRFRVRLGLRNEIVEQTYDRF